MTTAHSPVWANSAQTLITLTASFPWLSEEVPFAASPDDSEAHGRDLYARALAGEFGTIGAYVPTPAVVPTVVTMRQARLALLQSGLLSTVNAAVAGADEATKIAWEFSSEVQRSNPLVATLTAALSLTGEQLDDLFTLAATL